VQRLLSRLSLRESLNALTFTQSSMSGTLALDVFQIRISRIVFQYTLRPSAMPVTKASQSELHRYKWTLKAHEDPESLRIFVEQHHRGPHVGFPSIVLIGAVDLDKRQSCLLTLFTGRNAVEAIDIRLRDTTGTASFAYLDATTEIDGRCFLMLSRVV
jgi:hypothetical protein